LLTVSNLTVHFYAGRDGFWGGKRRVVHALDDISLTIAPGTTLGLVGESGSGKTTLGRAVLRRVSLTAGTILFRDEDITHTSGEALRKLRQHMQLVFQDPYASLNPRMLVRDLIAEPLIVHGRAPSAAAVSERVAELLQMVGLPADAQDRFAHAFSGGQRQRIGIARALALEPEFIVADEPVSALDVSIRAQVINLMQDLQNRLGLSYLFIAHDLAVVRHISHRIAIMYAGRIVEVAPRDRIYDNPVHPYTEALLSAVPIPDPELERGRVRKTVAGEIPNPLDPPPGCRFQFRCPLVSEQCRVAHPPLTEREPDHYAACWNR
jgi:peptide/nickel transport system ATP-binding protein